MAVHQPWLEQERETMAAHTPWPGVKTNSTGARSMAGAPGRGGGAKEPYDDELCTLSTSQQRGTHPMKIVHLASSEGGNKTHAGQKMREMSTKHGRHAF